MKMDFITLACFFTLVTFTNGNQDCGRWEYSCDNKCQSYSTPCEGLCTEDRVLIDNICQWSDYTWECNGKQQLLSTPCEGLCSKIEYDGDMVLIVKDNICEYIWNIWECNGILQHVNEPCNRQCRLGRCFSDDGLTCEEAPHGYYYSCGDKCQLWSTPCEGLCSFGLVLIDINNICEESWKTLECNGTIQRLSETCNRHCHEDRERKIYFNIQHKEVPGNYLNECDCHLLIGNISICKESDYTWECNGKLQLLQTPCNGLCSDGFVLLDNICEESIRTWECYGKHQLLQTPCNGLCSDDYVLMCLSEDGLSCETAPYEYYSCGDKCQPKTTPCNGLCSDGYVLLDNICEKSENTWECNGTIQHLNEPCNRQCRLDRCLSKDGLTCEYVYDSYSCDGKCQSWQMPCNGQCLQPLQLFDGACFYGNELQHYRKSDLFFWPIEKVIWECNGKEQLLATPCKGECPNNLTLVMGRCSTEDEFWVCDHVKQPISTPCYGLCSPITTNEEYYDKTESVYLTDYINCENECLLREHAWECNGRCISKKKSCDGLINQDFHLTAPCFVKVSISKNGEGILEIECDECYIQIDYIDIDACRRLIEASTVTSQNFVQTLIQNHSEPGGDLLHLTSLSDDHPNTTLGVYQKSKVIHNRFPVYYHLNRAYYIYVDKEGFWAVSNRIGFQSWTLYRNYIKPTPEQPPVSGWRYRDSIGLAIGGPAEGSPCVFPFTYNDNTYHSCTMVDDPDDLPWCSTKVDQDGKHIGGQGYWGHCREDYDWQEDLGIQLVVQVVE